PRPTPARVIPKAIKKVYQESTAGGGLLRIRSLRWSKNKAIMPVVVTPVIKPKSGVNASAPGTPRNGKGPAPVVEALSEERLGKLVGGKKAYLMALVAEEEVQEAARAEATPPQEAPGHHGLVLSRLNPQRRLLDKKTFPTKKKHLVRWTEEEDARTGAAAAASAAANGTGVKGEGAEVSKKGEDDGSVADVDMEMDDGETASNPPTLPSLRAEPSQPPGGEGPEGKGKPEGREEGGAGAGGEAGGMVAGLGRRAVSGIDMKIPKKPKVEGMPGERGGD
ncbi:hypothetical protein T484DRAFT_1793011, partial [Baffinella frigidus]